MLCRPMNMDLPQTGYAAMDKVVRIGTIQHDRRWVSVYCRIKYENGRLSITGVVGPLASGNAVGSCGQILDVVKRSVWNYAPGWNQSVRRALADVWERWHLNDMNAGTADQMAHIRAHPAPAGADWFAFHKAALESAGMGEGFGAAWYREEVPAEVLEWLARLPPTDRTPAWV